MKAACRLKYGKPDVLSIRDIPVPNPGDDEILIRVKAATVNRTDCANLTGKPLIMHLVTGFLRPKRQIPGTDFAGTVIKTGPKINTFRPGDNVWGFYDTGLSSQAEYLCISQKIPIGKMPETLTFQQAAASLEGAHYARNFLNKVSLSPGQKAMVNGGTGAIGSALIQLLTYHNIEVWATCRGEHQERVKALGARNVIDYSQEDFTHLGEKFDYVFDAVGKSTFGKCRKILAPKGIYISSELGPFLQNPLFSLLTPMFDGRKVKFPIPVDLNGTLQQMRELCDQGQFIPLIDRTFSLDEITSAYTYVLSGKKVGNVLLRIEG